MLGCPTCNNRFNTDKCRYEPGQDVPVRQFMCCSNDPATEWAIGVLVGQDSSTNMWHEILVGTKVDHQEESNMTTINGKGLNRRGEEVCLTLIVEDEELLIYMLGKIFFCDNIEDGRRVYTVKDLNAGLDVFNGEHMERQMTFQRKKED